MKKLLAFFVLGLGISISANTFAGSCEPNFQPDYQMNTGSFDVEAFKKQNNVEDSAGQVQMCFLGATQGGLNPSTVFSGVCGCKEVIKKHCRIKHGKIKASGVPTAWCLPFGAFL
ncbi:hypothetical protein ACI2KR_07655 [Pseudomonas luteola]